MHGVAACIRRGVEVQVYMVMAKKARKLRGMFLKELIFESGCGVIADKLDTNPQGKIRFNQLERKRNF